MVSDKMGMVFSHFLKIFFYIFVYSNNFISCYLLLNFLFYLYFRCSEFNLCVRSCKEIYLIKSSLELRSHSMKKYQIFRVSFLFVIWMIWSRKDHDWEFFLSIFSEKWLKCNQLEFKTTIQNRNEKLNLLSHVCFCVKKISNEVEGFFKQRDWVN